MGCRAIVSKSYARIFEANLKKQGVLALTFSSMDDYDVIQENDKITLEGLDKLAPGIPVTMKVAHKDGSMDELTVTHTLNQDEMKWFYAGSALNYVGSQKNQ